MPNSYNRIWLHAIWATKERKPFISEKIELKLYPFISKEFEKLGCPVSIINGMPDHIHCLFLLSPQKSISEIVKQVKGSSAYFINYNELILDKFSWQSGYAAYSVSESAVAKVFRYISNQKAHHKTKSFEEENDKLLKLHGFE